MTLSFTRMVALAGILAGAIATPAQTPQPCTDAAQALVSEVRSLRLALLEDRLERSQARTAHLQQQLRQIEEEQNRLIGQERSHAQELLDVQSRLSQPSLSNEGRADIEDYRRQLTSGGPPRLQERRFAIVKRDSEIRAALGREQAATARTVETIRSLGGSVPGN